MFKRVNVLLSKNNPTLRLMINECGCKMVNALLINSRMLSYMFVAVKAFMICYLKAQRPVTCLWLSYSCFVEMMWR